jgi:PTH1 family peptidyl-tRNA hydrolase
LRVVLGIGNPGNRYRYNRHNVGFLVLDYFATLNSLSFIPSPGDYFHSEGDLEGYNYKLIKPAAYVNNSGITASQVIENEKIEIKDLLVIHDDVHLPFADFRVKIKGGDGGHNGLNSIIYHLASEDFPRIRIGIGNNFEKGGMAEYVLSDFNPEEIAQLKNPFNSAVTLIKEFITGGIEGLLDANSRLSSQNPEKNDSLNGV